MEIIEKIKTNKSDHNLTEIQKICLHKLESNPLPNPKSELWRLSNKSKLSTFLDYSVNENDSKFDIPYPKNSQSTIRLIIGENCQIKLIEKNYSIQQLSEDELQKYIKAEISFFKQNENWSDLLNLSLSCKNNILGLDINESKIPPIEIFSHATSNSFNAKTLVIFLEKNCDVELLQVNLGKENSSLSQSTFLCSKENSYVNHGVVSYGENRSNLLNSLNVIQQKNSTYNLGSLHFKFNYARFEISIKQSAGNAKTNIKGMQITKKDEQELEKEIAYFKKIFGEIIPYKTYFIYDYIEDSITIKHLQEKIYNTLPNNKNLKYICNSLIDTFLVAGDR